MEAIETRNDEGCLKLAGLKMRSLATGVIVFAALFMMGLATEASAQSSSSIVVRARGTAGGESITLRVNNSNVATWTLTTSLQNYSASTTLTGNVTVAFTNDATGRDVQVDYIIVNGTTRQSENQSQQHRALREWELRRRLQQRMDALQRRDCLWRTLQLRATASSFVHAARPVASPSACGVNNTNVATWTLTTRLPELHRVDEPHRRHHRRIHQ